MDDLTGLFEAIGSNLFMLSVILGAIMPGVTSFVIGSTWSSEAKAIASVFVSVALGFVATLVAGQWNSADLGGSIILVFFAGVFMHRNFWKTSGLGPKLEEATSR